MRRLLRADIHSLFLDKVFIALAVFSFILGLTLPVLGLVNEIRYNEYKEFEDYFFFFLPVFSLLISSYVSIFVGKSFDWGTVKNKITVGHSRRDIYLSFLIVSMVGTLVFIALFLISYSVFGSLVYEDMSISFKALVLVLISAVLVLLSVTAISVALMETIGSRVISMIVSLFVVFALLLIGNYAEELLNEPEMISNSMIMVDGAFQFADSYPNPRFLAENKRWIYEALRDATLGGQMSQIMNMECNWIRVSLYSVFSSILATLVGCIIFSRKDLK